MREFPTSTTDLIIYEPATCNEVPPAFSCVRLTGGSLNGGLFQQTVVKPDTTFGWSYGATSNLTITSTSTPANVVVARMGILLVKYDSSWTPAYDDICGPKPGFWKVYEGYYGFQCKGIYNADAKVMWAMPIPLDNVICKPNAGISKGATGNVSIWTCKSGSEAVTGWTSVLARAKFNAVTSSKFCLLSAATGLPYVNVLEC